MDVVDRARVSESSRKPMRHMTTEASGIVIVADDVAVKGSTAVMAAVTTEGVPHVSPPSFCHSITTAWPSVGAADQSTLGLPSPDCQSRYHAMTLTEPVALPAATAPSAN